MEYDGHNNIDDRVALDPAAITTDTTTVGNIIDTAGYGSLEYLIYTKTLTDGDYAFLLEEGDDSGLSDAAAVPSAEVLGALTGFVVDTDDDAVLRVGSIGKKRYQRLSIVSTSTTTGVDILGAIVILGVPKHAPVAQ